MDKDVQPKMCFKRSFNSLKGGIYPFFSSSVETQILLNRTSWKKYSYFVEFNSFHTEIHTSLIRTWWKLITVKLDLIKTNISFIHTIFKVTPIKNLFHLSAPIIRTSWKFNSYLMESNSYSAEKKLTIIRTSQKSIRSQWKSWFDFTQVLFKTRVSISTSIYINKGLNCYGRI